MTMTASRVCKITELTPGLGVAALVGDVQVALFALPDGTVRCVQNLDPFSGASVMSRGITGSRGEVPTIASPLHKQVFSLDDGECLAAMDRQPRAGMSSTLEVYPVVVDNGWIHVHMADDRSMNLLGAA